jgi:CRISPR-associated protein Cas5t
MKYLLIHLRSRMASFRDPEFQNYHRTLPLPPPSTCIGMAGAALGLWGPDAQAFFPVGEWKLGVGGTSNGRAKDLWKFDDFKDGSIVLREYLYDNDFHLVFGHADPDKLEQLKAAFLNPVFSLTCGNSDSLCRVVRAEYVSDTQRSNKVEHCYVPGDLLQNVLDTYVEGQHLSIKTSSNPAKLELPVRYEYLKTGERMTRERISLSYVRYLLTLEDRELEGVNFELPNPTRHEPPRTRFLPVFPLERREP